MTSGWRISVSLLAGLGLGCSGPQVRPVRPSVDATVYHTQHEAHRVEPGMEMALGQVLHVSGSWDGVCKQNWVARNIGTDSSEMACNGKKFVLRVHCQTPCQVYPNVRPSQLPSYDVNETQRLVVVPLQAGPFTFDATLDSDAAGPAPSFHFPTINVREPESVTLMCLYPSGPRIIDGLRGSSKVEVCDDRPLMADQPWVRPTATFNGISYLVPKATLNGRTGFPVKNSYSKQPNEDGVVSLSDVFRAGPVPVAGPDDNQDDGIAPGRYEVVIGFGTSTTTVVLTVERR